MSFTTEVDNTVGYNVDVNNYENRLEWVLDSGCTDHIINYGKYFVKSNRIENPINVKIGDGRIPKTTKVGNIITKFVTNSSEKEVELKDVHGTLYNKSMFSRIL